MSIFDNLGNTKQPPRMTPQQAIQTLRSDPARVLKEAGLDIPAGAHVG